MSGHAIRLALLAVLAAAILPGTSQAQVGQIRIVIAKAGLVAGAGAGRGVLSYRGHDYPFRVAGLTLGLTVGASVNRLAGRVSYMNEVGDFPGIYTAVGAGGALVGGAGGVQLRNEKGVMITLQGLKAGVEFSANLTRLRISFR